MLYRSCKVRDAAPAQGTRIQARGRSCTRPFHLLHLCKRLLDLEAVGNLRKIIISELSGASSLVGHAKKLGIGPHKSDPRVKEALAKVKEMEKAGYSFDLAPESAFLVLAQHLGLYKSGITLDYWKVISENGMNVAVVKTNGKLGVAESSGPVGAIDAALRKALKQVYPEVEIVFLTDYRVVVPVGGKNRKAP